MKAEIINTGTELLLGQILNANAQYLGQKLAELGIDVYFQTSVGDNESRLAEVIENAMKRADLLIITGGLGPTTDDLTKETVANLLGIDLLPDKESLVHVEEFFRVRGRKMPEANKKQALVPKGAKVIPNRIGTAPGVIIEWGDKVIIILPGPPVEMRPMFEEAVKSYIRKRAGKGLGVIESKVLKILGVGESTVEERIKDLVENQSNPTIAFLAPKGEVYVRITAKAEKRSDAGKLIKIVEKEIRSRFGEFIYGADDDTMEKVVAGMLQKHALTISTAESCTGGLIAKRLTDIPGISDNFLYSIVSYSNDAKIQLLGVPPKVLDKYGAVSEETALEMVKGVRLAGGTDLAVSVTGIAGPGGGTPQKPVGLVYIAFADHETIIVQRHLFTGDREVIRWQTSNIALNMVRKYLLQYGRIK